MSGPGFATDAFQDVLEKMAETFLEEAEAVSAPFLVQAPNPSAYAYSKAQLAAQCMLLVLLRDLKHGSEAFYGFGLALGSAAAQSDGRHEQCRQNILEGFKGGLRLTRDADRRRG